MKIVVVAGARPNFVKLAPLITELKKYPEIETMLVHTGQHYDNEMSKVFFNELKIPQPEINLGVGSGTHAWQTAQIMIEFEKFISTQQNVDLVIVLGDVNSTLACALVTAKMGIKLAHIEAGMRSFNWIMPEEINRVITDRLSDYLFTTEVTANDNLIREGISPRKIFFVGNIMIDAVQNYINEAEVRTDALNKYELAKKDYALFTMHRAEITSNVRAFEGVMNALNEIQKDIKIVWPVHPRTKTLLNKFGATLKPNILLIPPASYLDFLKIIKNAKFVMTDSGGLQSETTILKVPCLTLRGETEHEVTLTHGTNEIVGVNPEKIIFEAKQILSGKFKQRAENIPKWDGRTAERIVNILLGKEAKGKII